MIRWLTILTLLLLLSNGTYSQNRADDEKLLDLIRSYGQADVIIPYPGREAIESITQNVSITSVEGGKVHISLSAHTVNWFTQQHFPYIISERSATKGLITASDAEQAMDWQSYPSYPDYVTIMKGFAAKFPAICKLDTIGKSIYGKFILVLKISDNVSIDEPEPEVFYTSTIHGDETGGFILMMRLADTLLKSYSSSQRIKNMVDNMEIWINPLSNPDGTYRTGSTITSPIRYNANGIDLNRNFPDPLSPSIVQEKETLDMMKFLRERRFVLSANFHAGGELVNYPWDRWYYKFHPDDTWFVSISRAYADTIHKYSGNGYFTDENNGITRGAEWYVIYGGRQDYVTWELQGREVTIELDHIHQTPAAQLELLWQYNRRSLLTYLENALYGVHGFVRDAVTSKPVAARIKIFGHDRDSSQVYSDTLTGVYTRMLYPRLWDISFSANGYRDTIIYNVQVISGQATILDVNMKPLYTGIIQEKTEIPVIYPNPASDYVCTRLPEKMDGMVRIRITDTGGRKFTDYETDYIKGEILTVDISNLPAGTYILTFTCKGTGLSLSNRLVVVNNRD